MRSLVVATERERDVPRPLLRERCVLHPRQVKHLAGCNPPRVASVLITQIDHLCDARLDDELRAFIAGEHRNVDDTPLQGAAVAVQDGVRFGVADEGVLGVQVFGVVDADDHFRGVALKDLLPAPRQVVVAAAHREAVVPDTHDAAVVVNDAGTYLAVGVFASLCGEHGDAHEVVIPR